MEIDTVTIILNNDYSINSVIKKTWFAFVNHITIYEIKKKEVLLKNNKIVLIDFYKQSLYILKEMDDKLKRLSLSDNTSEKNIKTSNVSIAFFSNSEIFSSRLIVDILGYSVEHIFNKYYYIIVNNIIFQLYYIIL